MSRHRRALNSADHTNADHGNGAAKEKKIMRDEQKSKEQLIDELFELRQRVAELEDAQEKRLSFVQGEINFLTPLPKRSNAKTLTGLISICTSCKKIRDDHGFWTQLEIYIREHSEAEFSHGLCPECVKKFYPVDILTRKSGTPSGQTIDEPTCIRPDDPASG